MLTQNTTQASTITCTGRNRLRGRLVPDTPAMLRVGENIFITLHLCHVLLTALSIITFYMGTPPGSVRYRT